MSYTHVVYVDEAGDEGIGKLKLDVNGGQSQWLLLGAVIVRSDLDRGLPKQRDAILARFPHKKARDLHFRNLKHEQKVVTCQEMAALPISSCVVFSNKSTISGSRWAEIFKRPGYLYNFLTRWLLERVTAHCASDRFNADAVRLKVVFSRRGGTNYQAMRDYMELLRDGREHQRPVRSIVWHTLEPTEITVERHEKWAGLQLADAVTSAYFNAVEPNLYGNYESR